MYLCIIYFHWNFIFHFHTLVFYYIINILICLDVLLSSFDIPLHVSTVSFDIHIYLNMGQEYNCIIHFKFYALKFL